MKNRKGADSMDKKRLGIVVIVVVCFFSCFIYLNKKYDRFYRISGIDNETRQLILNYLDEDEQDYLVEYSIATNRFLKYIDYEEFDLKLISYYEFMEETDKTFLSTQHLLRYTNAVVEKVKSLTNKKVSTHYKDILNRQLDELFLQSEDYDLSLTKLYAVYKKEFVEMKLTDLTKINALNEKLEDLGYSEEEKRAFLKAWQQDYTLDQLVDFAVMNQMYPDIELISYPSSLTTVISGHGVLSTYVPTPLTIPYSVSRISFGMYLRQDAAYSLEEMYKAISQDILDETFLLVGAYESYEAIKASREIYTGDSEFQLGLSIDVSVMNVLYDDFSTTKICQYLKENSWKYGFIQRYADPMDESYNEHIYRYVGKDAAKLIYQQQMSLEEYEGV